MGPARSVCGHPEAVQHSRTDQGPGAAEAAQPALPHARPTQRSCFPVTEFTFRPPLHLLKGTNCFTTLKNNHIMPRTLSLDNPNHQIWGQVYWKTVCGQILRCFVVLLPAFIKPRAVMCC